MIDVVAACERVILEDRYDDTDAKAMELNIIKQGIKKYEVFYGPIEDLLIMGRDFYNKTLDKQVFFNLYNLDFCDTITSSVSTNDGGNDKCRIGAISNLFTLQRQSFREERHFIILLTFRNQANSNDLDGALTNVVNIDAIQYKRGCGRGPRGREEDASFWKHKTILYDTIIRSCRESIASAFLYPLIRYTGGGGAPMIHWMLVCRLEDTQPSICISPGNFLSTVFSGKVDQRAGEVVIRKAHGEAGDEDQSFDPLILLNHSGISILSGL